MDAKQGFDRDAMAEAVCRALRLRVEDIFSDRRRLDCPPGVLAARAAITRIMRAQGHSYEEVAAWLGIRRRLLWIADHPTRREAANRSCLPHAQSVDAMIERVMREIGAAV